MTKDNDDKWHGIQPECKQGHPYRCNKREYLEKLVAEEPITCKHKDCHAEVKFYAYQYYPGIKRKVTCTLEWIEPIKVKEKNKFSPYLLKLYRKELNDHVYWLQYWVWTKLKRTGKMHWAYGQNAPLLDKWEMNQCFKLIERRK
ncbi:MAG: hypothetical protein AB1295_05875 [Candidatus Micrarchaeota archaeon]